MAKIIRILDNTIKTFIMALDCKFKSCIYPSLDKERDAHFSLFEMQMYPTYDLQWFVKKSDATSHNYFEEKFTQQGLKCTERDD